MMVAWGGWGRGPEFPLTSKAISQGAIAASFHLRASEGTETSQGTQVSRGLRSPSAHSSFTPGPGRPLLTQGPRAQLWPQLPIGPWGRDGGEDTESLMPTSTPSAGSARLPLCRAVRWAQSPVPCSHSCNSTLPHTPLPGWLPTSGYVPPTRYVSFKAAPQARREGQGKPLRPAA